MGDYKKQIHMITHGYSVWLMPEGRVYIKLTSLIKKLSAKYNSPVFEPHITLIGGLNLPEKEIIEKVRKLSLNQPQFKIFLQGVDCQDFYFRALFVKAAKTKPLLELNEKAQSIFSIKDPAYMPHLSLLYGVFPRTLKQIIIRNIKKDLISQFSVTSLKLFKTEGEMKDWYQVKSFSFIK